MYKSKPKPRLNNPPRIFKFLLSLLSRPTCFVVINEFKSNIRYFSWIYVRFLWKVASRRQKNMISLLGINISGCLRLSENEPLWLWCFVVLFCFVFFPNNLVVLCDLKFQLVLFIRSNMQSFEVRLIYGNMATVTYLLIRLALLFRASHPILAC